jgi:nicotinamidase-related amidase
MTRFNLAPDNPAGLQAAGALIPYIQGELRYFRERGRPIVFAAQLSHVGPDQDPNAELGPAHFIEPLTPRPSEPIIKCKAASAFIETNLDALLGPLNVKRLTLVGVQTNTAILLTAADAIARGYEVVVPDPCVAAADPDDHTFALRQIRQVWQKSEQLEISGTIALADAGVDASAQ